MVYFVYLTSNIQEKMIEIESMQSIEVNNGKLKGVFICGKSIPWTNFLPAKKNISRIYENFHGVSVKIGCPRYDLVHLKRERLCES